MDSDLRNVTAQVLSRGDGADRAVLRWGVQTRVLREDPLSKIAGSGDAWTRFSLSETSPPPEAQWLALVLVTQSGGPVWWDEARVTGYFQRTPRVRIYVNQVGYEIMAPKKFTVAANFDPEKKTCLLVDAKGSPVQEVKLGEGKRIESVSGGDWGEWYWRGDFTGYDSPGGYRFRVTMDAHTAESPVFEIGQDLLWSRTLGTAFAAFQGHRCGVEVAGIHPACHLDDPIAGGWHQGSDYGKTEDALCLWLLASAYGVAKWRFEKSPELAAAIQAEIAYGATYLQRSFGEEGSWRGAPVSRPDYWGAAQSETDNVPDTGDERRLDPGIEDPQLPVSALARSARWMLAEERAGWAETAGRGLDYGMKQGYKGPWSFNVATDLYVMQNSDSYAALMKTLYPGPNPICAENVVDYESLVDPNATWSLTVALYQQADKMVKLSNNPFGVYTGGTAVQPIFFDTPAAAGEKAMGNSRRILEAAGLAAQAYRYHPTPEILAFVYDQLNWILGVNPYSVCLMEGAGSMPVPSYAHRYSAGGLARGAVPGAIANGITGRSSGDDRPWFDMTGAERPEIATNGVELRTTAWYINTLCQIKRIRFSVDDKQP